MKRRTRKSIGLLVPVGFVVAVLLTAAVACKPPEQERNTQLNLQSEVRPDPTPEAGPSAELDSSAATDPGDLPQTTDAGDANDDVVPPADAHAVESDGGEETQQERTSADEGDAAAAGAEASEDPQDADASGQPAAGIEAPDRIAAIESEGGQESEETSQAGAGTRTDESDDTGEIAAWDYRDALGAVPGRSDAVFGGDSGRQATTIPADEIDDIDVDGIVARADHSRRTDELPGSHNRNPGSESTATRTGDGEADPGGRSRQPARDNIDPAEREETIAERAAEILTNIVVERLPPDVEIRRPDHGAAPGVYNRFGPVEAVSDPGTGRITDRDFSRPEQTIGDLEAIDDQPEPAGSDRPGLTATSDEHEADETVGQAMAEGGPAPDGDDGAGQVTATPANETSGDDGVRAADENAAADVVEPRDDAPTNVASSQADANNTTPDAGDSAGTTAPPVTADATDASRDGQARDNQTDAAGTSDANNTADAADAPNGEVDRVADGPDAAADADAPAEVRRDPDIIAAAPDESTMPDDDGAAADREGGFIGDADDVAARDPNRTAETPNTEAHGGNGTGTATASPETDTPPPDTDTDTAETTDTVVRTPADDAADTADTAGAGDDDANDEPVRVRDDAPGADAPAADAVAADGAHAPNDDLAAPPRDNQAGADPDPDTDRDPGDPDDGRRPIQRPDYPLVEITELGNNGFYNNSIRVTGRVDNGRQGLGDLEILTWRIPSIAGAAGDVIFSYLDGVFDLRIPTAGLQGPQELVLSVERRDGEAGEARMRIHDGTVAPVVRLESPTDQSDYGGRIFLEGVVRDPAPDHGQERGIAELRYSLDPLELSKSIETLEGNLEIDENGYFKTIVDMRELAGDYELSIEAAAVSGARAVRTFRLNEGASEIPSFMAQTVDGGAALYWDPVPLAESYSVYVENDGGDRELIPDVEHPFDLNGLANGRRYAVSLEARLSGNEAHRSSVREIVPVSPLTLAPTVTGGYNNIALEWNEIPGTNEFVILRSDSPDGPFFALERVTNTTEYVDSTALFGRRYYYRIAPATHGSTAGEVRSAMRTEFPEERAVVSTARAPAGARSIALLGNYAVIAGADGLLVFDVFDPAMPEQVGSAQLNDGRSVAVLDTTVYVADGLGGLKVYSLANPTEPDLIQTIDAAAASVVQVFATTNGEDYLVLGDKVDGLATYTLADPTRPGLVGRTNAFPVASVEHTAPGGRDHIVATGSDGTAVYSVVAGSLQETNRLDEVVGVHLTANAYTAGTLYLSHNRGVTELEISSRGMLVERSTIPLPGATASAVHRLSDGRRFLFAGTEAGSLVTYELLRDGEAREFGAFVLDSVSSLELRAIRPAGAATAGTGSAGRPVVYAAGAGGLSIADVHLVGRSFELSSERTNGRPQNVEAAAGYSGARYVYVADPAGGLYSMALSIDGRIGVAAPTTITDTPAVDVELVPLPDGGIGALTAAGDKGLYLVPLDIDRGTALAAGWSRDIGTAVTGVAGIYERAAALTYVFFDDAANLRTAVLRDGELRSIGRMRLEDPRDAVVVGRNALVADGFGGLAVVDIADPGAPRLLGRFRNVNARRIEVVARRDGSTIVAVADLSRVALFEVSAGGTARLVSSVATEFVEAIGVVGTYLYVAQGILGMGVIDLSDISRPIRVSEAEIGYITDIAGFDDVAVLVDGAQIRSVRVLIPEWLARREDIDGTGN